MTAGTNTLKGCALYRHLAARESVYAGKAVELEEAVGGLLGLIPTTFPHYTNHSLEHSLEIIRQISYLLFEDGDPAQPVVRLSDVECYILLCAALLHDIGMVVSDREKQEMLSSTAWQRYVAVGGAGHPTWRAIHELRSTPTVESSDVRNFLADVQLRHLLAEWVRTTHHARAVPVLARDQAALGRFAFDDPILLNSIASVCIGHGLPRSELDDPHQFPDRREIRGEQANLRFLALMLRLGDLLDLSHRRACPLLMSASSPLPPASIHHWQQYQRVRHRATAPDAIELDAECQTAEEHRLLRDWCQWIVDEVAEAPTLMAGARRHRDWRPPVARMFGPGATIFVRPSSTARYVPADWTFQLDADAIVRRLVDDVSSEPLLFVRELVQNALDALRRTLYDRVRVETHNDTTGPSSPLNVDAQYFEGLRVSVTLTQESVGKASSCQIVTIADNGVGMSEETVKRYLLQIGRSYYTTPDFRRTYPFTPTSKFGIGFWSVFRDSEHVTIETATSDDIAKQTGGLRITVTGPKNYLLVEHGTRLQAGTSIAVRLRAPIERGTLRELVTALCRRVEFPVEVVEHEQRTQIMHEQSKDFAWSIDLPEALGSRLEVKAFPVLGDGVKGELYVLSRVGPDGEESWADSRWASDLHKTHPEVMAPMLPKYLTCVNGLCIAESEYGTGMISRVDIRRPVPSLNLARSNPFMRRHAPAIPEIEDVQARVLRDHLETTGRVRGDFGWWYIQRLMRDYPLDAFWLDVPGSVPGYFRGSRRAVSIADLAHSDRICVLQTKEPDRRSHDRGVNWTARPLSESDMAFAGDAPLLVDWEVNYLSAYARSRLFSDRSVSVIDAGPSFSLIEWRKAEPRNIEMESVTIAHLGPVDYDVIGFPIHYSVSDYSPGIVLNGKSPLVQWYAARIEETHHDEGLTDQHVAALAEMLKMAIRVTGHDVPALQRYLDSLRTLITDERSRVPKVTLKTSSFSIPWTPQRRLRSARTADRSRDREGGSKPNS
ncbi:ATP-binding protein [Conexibacter stalactiti]|uniref:ATP-binding protein n=1 Tax=Conexibacter stalactiti TaxID=1940611 RepID=A0ABU4HKI6_9ACTN|nr:ATP-binding protein [Conexibacter stalactiti]MDW5593818.1 ATP-binding protein [Conexibacter stalactiti]MEC5034460.1 ATP-binding protein [Conexibacter stalactiti]